MKKCPRIWIRYEDNLECEDDRKYEDDLKYENKEWAKEITTVFVHFYAKIFYFGAENGSKEI